MVIQGLLFLELLMALFVVYLTQPQPQPQNPNVNANANANPNPICIYFLKILSEGEADYYVDKAANRIKSSVYAQKPKGEDGNLSETAQRIDLVVHSLLTTCITVTVCNTYTSHSHTHTHTHTHTGMHVFMLRNQNEKVVILTKLHNASIWWCTRCLQPVKLWLYVTRHARACTRLCL